MLSAMIATSRVDHLGSAILPIRYSRPFTGSRNTKTAPISVPVFCSGGEVQL